MPTPKVQVLEVRLNEALVGTLTHLPGERTLFVLDDDYVSNPDRPVLSLSFKTLDGVEAPTRPSRVKAPPFFSNLLPEGHLREYLARRGSVNPQREFFLLWLLGRDLPGAVVITPLDGEELPPTKSGNDRLAEEQNSLLRFSLAGIQLKFSAIMETHGGLTIPATGTGGSWIVKLPSSRYASVPEVEHAMLTLASAAGVQVSETRLVNVSEIENLPDGIADLSSTALAVRRFDRREDRMYRVHMEDFAQVFGIYPSRKYSIASYERIAQVLWAEAGLESVLEFVRRLTFSALIGNADMHLKNWTLLYPNGRTPVLSPAYDFVPTVAYIGSDSRMALSLGGIKEMSDLTEESFRRLARRAALPE